MVVCKSRTIDFRNIRICSASVMQLSQPAHELVRHFSISTRINNSEQITPQRSIDHRAILLLNIHRVNSHVSIEHAIVGAARRRPDRSCVFRKPLKRRAIARSHARVFSREDLSLHTRYACMHSIARCVRAYVRTCERA